MKKGALVSANKQAKALGLRDLTEVSEITQRKNRNTLHNWYNTNPALFKIVLLGCVRFKKLKKKGISDTVFLDKTPSKQVKSAGLKGIEEICRLTNKHRNTVYSWHERNPCFFKIVILGCVETKARAKPKIKSSNKKLLLVLNLVLIAKILAKPYMDKHVDS